MWTQWNGENYGFGNCILIVFEQLPSDKNIPQQNYYRIIEAMRWDLDRNNINIEIGHLFFNC